MSPGLLRHGHVLHPNGGSIVGSSWRTREPVGSPRVTLRLSKGSKVMPPAPPGRRRVRDLNADCAVDGVLDDLRPPDRDDDQNDVITSLYEREINRLDAAARSERR